MANKHSVCSLCNFLAFLLLIQCCSLAWTTRESYIVHMDSSAMPSVFPDKHHWFKASVSSVSQSSETLTQGLDESVSPSRITYSYTHAINGFSATFTPEELELLKKTPGFIEATKDMPVKYDTTHSIQFLGLGLESEGLTRTNMGEGVIIGVIDTGVWPESESFRDDGMPPVPARWKGKCEKSAKFNSSLCNRKLIGAQIFNKGLLAENVPVPSSSVIDTDGHGTHTSSTAAGSYVENASYFGYASGLARGVAAKAHIAMYKAIWDEGSSTSDIIAAIDQAIMDGVDVISMSFGLNVALYNDPVAIASLAAVEKNTFVSTSAGNSGPELESLHNGIPWVLTVAAGTMDRELLAGITLGNRITALGTSIYPGSNIETRQVPLALWNASTSFTVKDADKKIIICLAKRENMDDLVDSLDLGRAFGVVFIVDISEYELDFYLKTMFPSMFLTVKDGATVLDYIKATKNPTGSMFFGVNRLAVKDAPSLATYSSRGPSRSCPAILKPDIMAPGDHILASWPTNSVIVRTYKKNFFGKFNLLSGTSMACPHAAGVAALIKKLRPDWSPAAIRSAMMTTAYTVSRESKPIQDLGSESPEPANPLGMGSGHVNPTKALDPGLVHDLTYQDYVKLVCAMKFTAARTRMILRTAKYDCVGATLDINYPSIIAYFNRNTTIQQFQRTVTNVGKKTSSYSASVTPVKGCKVTIIPTRLDFSAINQKLSYKVVIEASAGLGKDVAFGYLRWVSANKRDNDVSIPLVATRMKVTRWPQQG